MNLLEQMNSSKSSQSVSKVRRRVPGGVQGKVPGGSPFGKAPESPRFKHIAPGLSIGIFPLILRNLFPLILHNLIERFQKCL